MIKRYVRYNLIGKTADHREEWVNEEEFRDLVRQEMTNVIKKLVIIKRKETLDD